MKAKELVKMLEHLVDQHGEDLEVVIQDTDTTIHEEFFCVKESETEQTPIEIRLRLTKIKATRSEIPAIVTKHIFGYELSPLLASVKLKEPLTNPSHLLEMLEAWCNSNDAPRQYAIDRDHEGVYEVSLEEDYKIIEGYTLTDWRVWSESDPDLAVAAVKACLMTVGIELEIVE